MKEPTVAVADGLRILRNDRAERVQAHGIPDHLLGRVGDLDATSQKKVVKALAFYQRSYRVFLLTGPESPTKETLSVAILCGFMGYGKLVRYYLAPSFNEHDVGYCALMGIDQVKGLQAIKIQNFIRTHVGGGRAIIIGGTTKDILEDVLETSLMDYVAHMAIEIDSPAERPRIPVV